MKKKQNLFKTTGVTCEFMKLEKLEELKDFSEFAKISGFPTIFARSGSPETKTVALNQALFLTSLGRVGEDKSSETLSFFLEF